jgi:hypothetical protein
MFLTLRISNAIKILIFPGIFTASNQKKSEKPVPDFFLREADYIPYESS